jgi:hypothetical protein
MQELLRDDDIAYFFRVSPVDKSSLYQTSMEWLGRVKSKVVINRMIRHYALESECSFRPNITNLANSVVPCFQERLADDDARRRISSQIRLDEKSKREDFSECTFSPKILQRRRRINILPHPVSEHIFNEQSFEGIPRINSIPRNMKATIRYASIPVHQRLYPEGTKSYLSVPIDIPREFNQL